MESAETCLLLLENPDQVMDSFESGATLAYCNPDCYRESITQENSMISATLSGKIFNDMADD